MNCVKHQNMQNDNINQRVRKLNKLIDLLNWNDDDIILDSCRIILEQYAKKELLSHVLAYLPEKEDMFSLCEHKKTIDKITLYKSVYTETSIRLHLFSPAFAAYPEFVHEHRWSFCSYILQGGYIKQIFAQPIATDQIKPDKIFEAFLGKGDVYYFSHKGFHIVKPLPGTVSMLIRGPSCKEQAYHVNPSEVKMKWHLGGKKDKNSMTIEYFQSMLDTLKDAQLI